MKLIIMSYIKIFLLVLVLDLLVGLMIAAPLFDSTNGEVVVFSMAFYAFMGICIMLVLGFAFWGNTDSSPRLRRIGKVLLINVIIFPVVMYYLLDLVMYINPHCHW